MPSSLLRKSNILIVDDRADNLRLLSTTLTNIGYEVRSAISAKVALMGIEAEPPDLILLDINMPEINGYDLCIQLKHQPTTANIPIIFISALDDGLDKKRAFNIGGADYITKPFQIEEVLVRIQHQLTLQKTQQELARKNDYLTQTLEKLKDTQAHLIQTEKLSALGKMVAGIAHEFNNPVTFIQSNLDYVQDYFKDLLKLIHLYQVTYPDPPSTVRLMYKDIDFDYIRNDFDKALTSIGTGANRIQAIVKSLSQFSRLNESGSKLVNIHQCIDSALTIIETQGVMPDTLKVQKHYGETPNIMGFPGHLNQAFYNLLQNAVEAIQNRPLEAASIAPETQSNKCPDQGILSITTQYLQSSNQIRIDIQDTGCGIPPELLPQIFNPFFTTKPVGQGLGIGLTNCHQIITEQHQGHIDCQSSIGQGSTFTIQLPIGYAQ